MTTNTMRAGGHDSSHDLDYWQTHHPDRGCAAASLALGGRPSSCFACPFPECDDNVNNVRRNLRDGQIVALAQQGRLVPAIARETKVSQRTVRRVLQRRQLALVYSC